MARRGPYPQDVRERAVRVVFAKQDSHDWQWAAIRSVADKIGCTAGTVRNWVRQAETDEGRRPRPTTEELKQLRHDNAKLRRVNEILKPASTWPGGRVVASCLELPQDVGAIQVEVGWSSSPHPGSPSDRNG